MNFQFSPGLLGYGARGSDGSNGIPGLGLYFTDYDPISNVLIIENAIANNEVLWSTDAGIKLPDGRIYVTGDLFIDNRGFVYQINAETDDFIKTPGLLNKAKFFQSLWNIESDTGYQRYHNIVNSTIDPIVLIDNVNTRYGSPIYTDPPKYLYGIESKNYARIEYTDISRGSYFPFTVYSSGLNAIEDDSKSFGIVYNPSDKSFNLGNLDSCNNLRNTNLLLDVSSLIHNRGRDIKIDESEGTILTLRDKNIPLMMDPNFNGQPTSFYAIPQSTSIKIYWNLKDFVNDPSVKATLYFNRRREASWRYYMDASAGNTAVPISFIGLDPSGSLTISACTISKSYNYYIVLSKNGWERSSVIRSATCTNTPPQMIVLDPSSKILSADTSGWFSSESTFRYGIDLSSNSITGWNATADQTWVSLFKNSSTGAGLYTMDVSLGFNNNTGPRTATITIFSEALNASVGIIQAGQPAITAYFNNDGVLTFSQPLTNQSVTVNFRLYTWAQAHSGWFETVHATTICSLYSGSSIKAQSLSQASSYNYLDGTKTDSDYIDYTLSGITKDTSIYITVKGGTGSDAWPDGPDCMTGSSWSQGVGYAQILSVVKDSPVLGGGNFSMGTNKYFYKKRVTGSGCALLYGAVSTAPTTP